MTLAIDRPSTTPSATATRYAITVTMVVTAISPPDPVDALRQLVGRLPLPDNTSAVVVDVPGRTVRRDGEPVTLSRREFDLLLFLAENPGQVFSRGQLLALVWRDTFTGERTVDVHVRRIRQKLAPRAVVSTLRGVGYRLAPAAPVTVLHDPVR